MRRAIISLFGLFLLPSAAGAALPDAAESVNLGIEHFKAGDYAAAAKAFADADAAKDSAEKDDAKRIAFDRGCAYAAEGNEADAIEWFQKAALSEDPALAARAHYNMGCLDVDKARRLFGEKPEEATPDVRKQGVDLLDLAMGHFHDALSVEENGENGNRSIVGGDSSRRSAQEGQPSDARHNLEAARLWIRYMKEVWRRGDLQKQREKLNLVQYLEMLDRQQRALRTTSRSLAGRPRSPTRRQAVFTTETSQRHLADEIEPLKAKIQAALQSPTSAMPGAAQQPTAATQPDPQKAAQVLAGLADNAGVAMLAAADQLGENRPADAARTQAEVVEKLDQITMVVLPYTNLVQKAIKTQTELVAQSSRALENLNESAWRQRFVTRYSDVIRAKARQGLKNMPPPEPDQQKDAADQKKPPDEEAKQDQPKSDQPQQDAAAEALKREQQTAKKRQEALREAMQKAVELAPKVRTLTAEAAGHLEDQEPAPALPKQEEALKLLKEMLPKDEQQKQQDQNKDKKDQDKKDKDKDKNKKDQDKKDQDKKDKDKDKDKGKDKKEQEKKDQDKKPSGDDQKKQHASPQDLSKQQADAVLKKARARQQERRKMEKLLQKQLYRGGKVEKDW